MQFLEQGRSWRKMTNKNKLLHFFETYFAYKQYTLYYEEKYTINTI
jgi:hypothetical protein